MNKADLEATSERMCAAALVFAAAGCRELGLGGAVVLSDIERVMLAGHLLRLTAELAHALAGPAPTAAMIDHLADAIRVEEKPFASPADTTGAEREVRLLIDRLKGGS